MHPPFLTAPLPLPLQTTPHLPEYAHRQGYTHTHTHTHIGTAGTEHSTTAARGLLCCTAVNSWMW